MIIERGTLPLKDVPHELYYYNITFINQTYKINVQNPINGIDCPFNQGVLSAPQTAYREYREFHHLKDVFISTYNEMFLPNGDFVQLDRYWHEWIRSLLF